MSMPRFHPHGFPQLTCLCRPVFPLFLALVGVSWQVSLSDSAYAQPPAEQGTRPGEPAISALVKKALDEAEQLRKSEKWNDALLLAEQAIKTAVEAKDLRGEAKAQHLRGELLVKLNKSADALGAFRLAATGFERLNDGDAVILVSNSANVLGIASRDSGAVLFAKECYQYALSLREKYAPNTPVVANSYNNMGIIARQFGDLAEAERYHQLALGIREKIAPDSTDVAISLNNLGVVADDWGDLVKARDLYTRALAICKARSPESSLHANILTNLGIIARFNGDLDAAADYHIHALTIREKAGSNSAATSASLDNLGVVERARGNFEAGRSYIMRSIAIQEKVAPESVGMGNSLNNLGNIAYDERKLDEANQLHLRAYAVRSKVVPDSLFVAVSLNNLGNVARLRGALGEARKYHAAGLALRERLAPDSLHVADSLGNLGRVAFDENNIVEAEGYFKRSWAIWRRHSYSSPGTDSHISGDNPLREIGYRLALVQRRLGKQAEAVETLEATRAITLQQTLTESKTITFRSVAVYRVAQKRQDQVMARVSSTATRVSLIQQSISEWKQRNPSLDAATAEDYVKMEAQLKEASRQFQEANRDYTQARLKTEDALAEVRKSNPVAFPAPLTAREMQRTLPLGMLYAAWVVDDNEVLLILLERNKPAATIPLQIAPEKLLIRVSEWRAALTRSETTAHIAMGRELFTALFPAEARPRIKAAQRLLISPDGPLWYVPFGALVMNQEEVPQFLGIEKAITYTPSLTVFTQVLNSARRIATTDRLRCLAVGNPRFLRQGVVLPVTTSDAGNRIGKVPQVSLSAEVLENYGGETPNLWSTSTPPEEVPSTGEQAVQIAALYGSTPLLREQATETNVRRLLPTADIIHIASHGRFLDTLPMGSGVLLTVPDKKPLPGEHENDGALQAWEFLSMKLKADIAVFGACEVGLGKAVQGEGILGMARSLQIAGVRSTVVGLWQVEDKSTRDLMIAFHRYCREGKARDEALRLAMKTIADKNLYRHPYYWAPFILVGENGPLSATRLPAPVSSGKKQPQSSHPRRD